MAVGAGGRFSQKDALASLQTGELDTAGDAWHISKKQCAGPMRDSLMVVDLFSGASSEDLNDMMSSCSQWKKRKMSWSIDDCTGDCDKLALRQIVTSMVMNSAHVGNSTTEGLPDMLENHAVLESLHAHGYAEQRMLGARKYWKLTALGWEQAAAWRSLVGFDFEATVSHAWMRAKAYSNQKLRLRKTCSPV